MLTNFFDEGAQPELILDRNPRIDMRPPTEAGKDQVQHQPTPNELHPKRCQHLPARLEQPANGQDHRAKNCGQDSGAPCSDSCYEEY
ncbi:hypothetical protein Pcinc_020931 [Petrolisthes cinctipes]|uniref:Uncharacterized protein n=1 Tax=Petrolisthes cinctipes TaxID=88211 RepID=A0AAE1FGU7_PETCI|nr:hypothetical protein Pcinc_020931 [Petrolisthes cinctipes]